MVGWILGFGVRYMCGILGLISSKKNDYNQFLKGLRSIKHRGTDDTRMVGINENQTIIHSTEFSNESTKRQFPIINQDSSIYLGFNRLSIVDVSENAMQPFLDDEGRLIFMMVGEIYNYQELTKKFSLQNLKTKSDSEVAFRLYRILGDEFIHHLRGMFSIVIYDQEKKQLKIWRDRFGVKPLFYSKSSKGLAFSSEIEPMFRMKFVQKESNAQGLLNSLFLGTANSPFTIFNEVKSLPPASFLKYDLLSDNLNIRSYWNLEYEPDHSKLDIEELHADFQEVIGLSLTGEVQKSVMLSGGLDSGLLAHYASRKDKSLEAIHLSHQFPDLAKEIEQAKQNAANASLRLNVAQLPKQVTLEQALSLAKMEEEPSTSPEVGVFMANEAHRLGNKVLFSALGLDELFGGYDYFIQAKKILTLNSIYKLIPEVMFKGKAKRYEAIKTYGLKSLPFIKRSQKDCKFYAELLEPLSNTELLDPLYFVLNDLKINSLPILKQISYLDLTYYLGSHHAFRNDRPYMKKSIECRVPFLDHLFIQKWFNRTRVFDDLKSGNNKPLVRKLAENKLSAKVLTMPKQGFSTPRREWLKNEKLTNALKDYIYSSGFFKNLDMSIAQEIIENSWEKSGWQLFSLVVQFEH